jgi:hypothetical protein
MQPKTIKYYGTKVKSEAGEGPPTSAVTLESRPPWFLGGSSCQLRKSFRTANKMYSRAEHVFTLEHLATYESTYKNNNTATAKHFYTLEVSVCDENSSSDKAAEITAVHRLQQQDTTTRLNTAILPLISSFYA